MATAYTINRTTKWGNVISVPFDVGVGSAGAGDTYDIVIPGGYWQICGLWAIKIGTSGAGDAVTLSVVDSAGSASSVATLYSGVATDNTISVGTIADETKLLVSPGYSLRLTSVNAGVGAGAACKVFVQMVQTNP